MHELENIFSNIPKLIRDEIFETILSSQNFRLERIISAGHSTPKETWFDQESYEWVILLKGAACIYFENDESIIELNPGDYILIKPHERHRLEWTSTTEETIWLAFHFDGNIN